MPMRALAWIHRWFGIAGCLLFAMWFASGFVMLFVPFPSLPDADRLAAADAIDFGSVRWLPSQVAADHPALKELRLLSVQGSARYLLQEGGSRQVLSIDAQNGHVTPWLDAAGAGRIAIRFAKAPVRRVIGPLDRDQWTVHQGFDTQRPYFRVDLDDGPGTTLHVSAVTGEVRQKTTRAQRRWNSIGAVLHWIYVTPVRANWALWDRLVWWLSLSGMVVAASGLVVGVLRFVAAKRRSGRGFAAFRGWWRWHHVLGLAAGILLLTWISSGWLSMDHGRLFSRGEFSDADLASLQGRPLAVALLDSVWQADPGRRGVKEIRFDVLGGMSIAIERGNGSDAAARLRDDTRAFAALREAWPREDIRIQSVDPALAFQLRAEDAPTQATVFRLVSSGRDAFRDPESGRWLALVDDSRRAYAWTYYGLHTWRVPWLEGWPWLRRGLMMLALGAGLALSLTGCVLGFRRLRTP